MLETVILMAGCAIFIPIFILEWRSHQRKKLLEEMYQCCMFGNIDALELLLKSRRVKYISESDRYTYSEYLNTVRRFNEVMRKYNEKKN